ncbi:hypothetical protein DXX93_11510 [Thalassotalea euphylliae]|uniref:Uncharacterized protein n=1 Tax=Thalassotalea euphylliae TaxID=1655234 RepID=A0A3E0TR54_9GAMM|nr:hypothetical protein [Thalassotalea euphylliae]REL27131.1 hypothetical protein DXX93_11510 [Thalassotalea euphylliae]
MTKLPPFIILILFLISGCKPNNEGRNLAQVPSCIFGQSSCQLASKFGDISPQFNQTFLVAETPFELHINELGNAVEISSAYMAGEDMFMGKIPLFFKPKAQGGWVAQSMFGSCAQAQMTWRVWLTLKAADGEMQTLNFTVKSFRSLSAIPEGL